LGGAAACWPLAARAQQPERMRRIARTHATHGPAVCLTVKPVGEPDALIGHVRFDERGWETERCRMAQATAPILNSTPSAVRGIATSRWLSRVPYPERYCLGWTRGTRCGAATMDEQSGPPMLGNRWLGHSVSYRQIHLVSHYRRKAPDHLGYTPKRRQLDAASTGIS
jgi:hypothetical protein